MKQVVYKLKCTVVGIDTDRPPQKKKLQETTINKQINLTYSWKVLQNKLNL